MDEGSEIVEEDIGEDSSEKLHESHSSSLNSGGFETIEEEEDEEDSFERERRTQKQLL